MKENFKKKINTIFRLNWHWAFNFYKKRLGIFLDYLLSRLVGRDFWEIKVGDIEVKLSFLNYYHHHFAKILVLGKHEKKLLDIWGKACEEKKIIVDIGGYNGIYGLIAAKANPKSTVYIFEPDVLNAEQIEKNIRLNDLTNIILVQSAISNNSGKELFTVSGETGGHITEGGIPVDSLTIDDFFMNRELPDLYKIDIEGAELLCLEGAKSILTKKPADLLVEVHGELIKNYGGSLAQFDDFVENIGYKKEHLKSIEKLSINYYWVYPVGREE